MGPRPKQFKHVAVGRVGRKTTKVVTSPGKISSPMATVHQMICRLQILPHNIDWKRLNVRKDHLWSKAQEKNKEKQGAAVYCTATMELV